jgi:hypothetical protein
VAEKCGKVGDVMTESLSPQQFTDQHVGFDRWAATTEKGLRYHPDYQTGPGAWSYPPEAGRKIARLHRARTMLSDTYSDAAHAAFQGDRSWLHETQSTPLHEHLPDHTDLVNEYLQTRGE